MNVPLSGGPGNGGALDTGRFTLKVGDYFRLTNDLTWAVGFEPAIYKVFPNGVARHQPDAKGTHTWTFKASEVH